MQGRLGKKIREIADGVGMTPEPTTTQIDKCIADFEAAADEWATEFIKKLLDWLYDNNYMRPSNTAGTLSYDTIIEQFLRDEGIIRNIKCRTCNGPAYEIDEGKFHCSICGNVFDEDKCPRCGNKMQRQHEGEKFTPFWICTCGYNTEAAT